MLRSIGLQKSLFFVNIPTRIFEDFWYVIKDMFLNQNPLKNILLQLVTRWPTFDDKIPELQNYGVFRSIKKGCLIFYLTTMKL